GQGIRGEGRDRLTAQSATAQRVAQSFAADRHRRTTRHYEQATRSRRGCCADRRSIDCRLPAQKPRLLRAPRRAAYEDQAESYTRTVDGIAHRATGAGAAREESEAGSTATRVDRERALKRCIGGEDSSTRVSL